MFLSVSWKWRHQVLFLFFSSSLSSAFVIDPPALHRWHSVPGWVSSRLSGTFKSLRTPCLERREGSALGPHWIPVPTRNVLYVAFSKHIVFEGILILGHVFLCLKGFFHIFSVFFTGHLPVGCSLQTSLGNPLYSNTSVQGSETHNRTVFKECVLFCLTQHFPNLVDFRIPSRTCHFCTTFVSSKTLYLWNVLWDC